MAPIWGIDLGGTKIEGVVMRSKENPEVLSRLRVPTEADKGNDHILQQIKKLIGMMGAEVNAQPSIIGVGTPGTVDPITGKMKNSNTTCLNGTPFKEGLEEVLGIPVKTANDANCFAIAETKFGIVQEKMPEAKVVFGVIMGSGVGGGIVVNGEVLNGRQGICGEWGHNPLDVSGGPCYCGKTGCVETVISGKSLERYYKEQTGNSRLLKEIVADYKTGKDSVADQTLERLIHFFGKGISNVINILDPDAIVIGGGVGNIDLLYKEGVEEARKHVFNHRLDTVFLKPKLGDSAGVFGAALLV
jgi:fructokinase